MNTQNVLFCAQCSPRPACPLNGPLLMQVHDSAQGAPVLALAGELVSLKRMQNHAPYDAWLFYGKMAGFSGIFERPTVRPVLRVFGHNSDFVLA